jgi:hypothetical protein
MMATFTLALGDMRRGGLMLDLHPPMKNGADAAAIPPMNPLRDKLMTVPFVMQKAAPSNGHQVI